jgi:hypothetical protein
MARITGHKEIRKKILSILKKTPKVYSAAITDVALRTRGRSQELTPIDTGFLRSSATSGTIKFSEDGALGYVGYSASYAPVVHESTWIPHKAPTMSKFLETASAEIEPMMLEIIEYYLENLF